MLEGLLGISESDFVLGTVGRLHEVKNYKFLIDIFEEVLKEKRNAVLVLAGDGPQKSELKEIVSEKGLSEKVYFLGNRSDIISVYSAMDVFILTSKHESCSLATLEAQAVGLKCVVSSGIPEDTLATDDIYRMHQKSKIEGMERGYSSYK